MTYNCSHLSGGSDILESYKKSLFLEKVRFGKLARPQKTFGKSSWASIHFSEV